jgi:hypothetical protein
VCSYVLCLLKLAHWAGGDPAEVTEEQVRGYFLHVLNDKGYEPKTMRQARVVLCRFFNGMLGREWRVFATIKTKDLFKMPASEPHSLPQLPTSHAGRRVPFAAKARASRRPAPPRPPRAPDSRRTPSSPKLAQHSSAGNKPGISPRPT